MQRELRRIIESDFGLIAEVNGHLLQMQGKMFRPTLLLLSEEASSTRDPHAPTLAAVIELIHLATLVHDDSVDHSVLRRGMPTINALFSHQISVIMGDYLYSRAVVELTRLGDLEPLRVLSRVTNEMTVGEMRQLMALEPLAFSEAEYDLLIRSKTASLVSGACEVGALRAEPVERQALRRFGEYLGMAFQVIDDLLDYVGDKSVTGKPSGSDLREHKVTLPLIFALERMDPIARKQVERLMATPNRAMTRSPMSLAWWRKSAASSMRGNVPSAWRSRQSRSSMHSPPARPGTRCAPVSPTCWTAGANGKWTEATGLLSWRARRRIHRGRVLYRSHQGSGSGQRRQDRFHRHLEPFDRAGVD